MGSEKCIGKTIKTLFYTQTLSYASANQNAGSEIPATPSSDEMERFSQRQANSLSVQVLSCCLGEQNAKVSFQGGYARSEIEEF